MKIQWVCMAALLVAGISTSAWAQSVPYRAAGTNAIYEPGSGDYYGEGRGLHVGRHLIDGNVMPVGDFFPEEGIFFRGTFTGVQTVIAADGSTLTMTLYGDVELTLNEDGSAEGMWFPIFEVTGGTGRFLGATGQMEGVAINPPFDPSSDAWPFDWRIAGRLHLNKRRR